MDDPEKKNAVLAYEIEAFILLGIALLVVALRTGSRIKLVGIRHFEADDYLVLVGAVFHCLETACGYGALRARGIANNSMTDEQRATLDPGSDEYHARVLGSKIQIMGYTCYTVLLWSLKAAMCNFYLRLTRRLWKFRRRVYFGFAFIGLSWLVVILNLYLSCRPLSRMWQINPNPGRYCQPAISPAILGTTLTLNVVTDLYLMTIPIPILLELHIKPRLRIGLAFLFCCAFFIIAAACLRVALIVHSPVRGALLSASWAIRESFISVIVTNLPVIFPLFKHWLAPIISYPRIRLSGSRRQHSSSTAEEALAHPPSVNLTTLPASTILAERGANI